MVAAEVQGDSKDAAEILPAGAEGLSIDPTTLQDIDFDDGKVQFRFFLP